MSFTVAIVSRPNVGKSTLFNRLVGRRLALVDDQPGVTRDRREGDGRLGDLTFKVIDTAGLEDAQRESLSGRMQAQTAAAIAQADVVLFLVDARAGATGYRSLFADLVRKSGKPAILVANKSEGRAGAAGAFEAYSLGLGDPIAISAEHNEGLADLYDALCAALPNATAPHERDESARSRSGGSSDPDRDRWPAQYRKIDADQPPARRGSAADRSGSGYHARLDRGRTGSGAANVCLSTIPPVCAAARELTRSSKSFRWPMRSMPSALPKW